ncbi:MAG: biotin carboxyl carrier domain-containing protein [Chloroflexi bacterium]|nr:MAG: biotin carboxyl carrier domain-containing protein [Chloroflexota bacterium]
MADPRKVRADANAIVPELLERLARDEVHELETRRGGVRVRVAKLDAAIPAAVVPTGARASAQQPAAGAVAAKTTQAPTINAPLTGIFYRSPSPQAQAYVQVGSTVGVGEVIGLIEAMKLFNEIHATASGRVSRIFIENGQLVRAHQPLVELEPV